MTAYCSHHQSSLFLPSYRWMELLEEAVRNATRHPGAAPTPVHPPPPGPQESTHQSPRSSRCLALEVPLLPNSKPIGFLVFALMIF